MVRLGLVIVALVVSAGCKEKQPPARAVTPPTVEEAEAIGKEFAKHLSPCDASAIDRIVDADLIITRAVANRSMREGDLKGIRRSLGSIGNLMCQQLQNADLTATYLRTQIIDGTPRPLIRLLSDAGLNYHQLELDKRANTVRIADVYLYLIGEKMSEMLGSIADMVMNTPSSTAMGQINDLKTHMRAKQWQEAHTKFKALPASMRSRKPIMLTGVLIAAELGDEEYVKAMDAYAKAFPNDASLALVQIDRTLLKKDYEGTLRVADQLDKQLGGDPYLEILRIDAYIGLGKPADAVVAAKRGVAADPSLQQLWWALLTAQTAAGQFEDALPTLEKLAAQWDADASPEGLAADERFVKLAESDAYKAWRAKQPK